MQLNRALSEILRRADIVEIARHLGLKLGRKEAGFTRALCPFHEDRDPSLALYSEPGNPHYFCFACGASGGLIDLVEKQRHTTRGEGVRWLAEVVGVDLPKGRVDGDAVDGVGVTRFTDWLDKHDDQTLMAAFAERRGLSVEVFAAAGARAVDMGRLKPKQLTPGDRTVFERAGVLIRRRDALVPVVTGPQIVFPLGSDSDAFLFRTAGPDVPGDGKRTRYRFSKGFRKAETVFGLDEARLRISGEGDPVGLFVVEGIMDVLRLRQLGMTAVAVLGASVSGNQAAQIQGAATSGDRVVPIHLFLDADEAGRRATASAIRALFETEDLAPVDVVEANRPGDPDELLRDLDPISARTQLAAWTYSVLAALTRQYTNLPISSALADLSATRPLLRVEVLRYAVSQLGARWRRLRETADPDATYLPGSASPQRTWLYEAVDRAVVRDVAAVRRSQVPETDSTPGDDDVFLRRALRIAQSSNFRREYPFDWGGMTRLALAPNAASQAARALMQDAKRPPLPYAARFVPKDDGRARLKAGPWPEDALLQQYVLSELLRARSEAPGWYLDMPAVRLVRTGRTGPVMTGPDWLLPVGTGNGSAPVVSFAYQVDQQIIDGEAPPRREGMFVPYRECWQGFVDHLDGFVARQSLATSRFFAVRLDVGGFFDNLPRYAVEDVLKRALEEGAQRNFAGRDFASEVAGLLKVGLVRDGEAAVRDRAAAVTRWLLDQSFGYRYFDPEDGSVRAAKNPTVGIPQGPDLSAYLANLALFPLDRMVTEAIEADRLAQDEPNDHPRAVYGRYVDDLVIITSSDALLSRLESVIGLELGRRGLTMNAKHDRPQAMSRGQIREWLLGERGAAVMVSAGGSETPTTTRAGVAELIEVGANTRRSDVLQLLHSDELYAPEWTTDARNAGRVAATLRRLRGLGSLKLRYYDWVSAGRWVIHSVVNRDRGAGLSKRLLETWFDIHGRESALPVFGEDPRDFADRQDRLTVAPLLILFDAIERAIDSRHDRRGQVDARTRTLLRTTRMELTRAVRDDDLCGTILTLAADDNELAGPLKRVRGMLEIQRLIILGLAVSADPDRLDKVVPVQIDARMSYVQRRFALNALGPAIAALATPVAEEIRDTRGGSAGPEAEPLLLLHESLARLRAGEGRAAGDPLDPIAATVEATIAILRPYSDVAADPGVLSAERITALVDLFLEHPEPSDEAREVDPALATCALKAFVEVVAGRSEGLRLLASRRHLMAQATVDEAIPVAMPPGVDAAAVFARSGDALEAFAFRDNSGSPTPHAVVFGLEAAPMASEGALARYECVLPVSLKLSEAQPPRLDPSSVQPADLGTFARAYRDLASAHAAELAELEDDEVDRRPITPLHLLAPAGAGDRWSAFGGVARLPVGPQAFVRLGDHRLHSIAVYANGAHLWQIGFALSDHLGYRPFARSSELDRLTVAALEPDDTPASVPFYVMQLTIPQLCGAFMGRSRTRIDPAGGFPPALERQLARLERLADGAATPASQVAMLLEAGAEARAADTLKDPPAPLQIAGALSAVFRTVGRQASRSEPLFTRSLPPARTERPTHRRTVDLWLSAASRLDGLPAADRTVGLSAAAAAMRVGAVGRLAQALTLEIWALIPDDERQRLVEFRPSLADFQLPEELLLVSRAHTQRAPRGDDQAVRLVSALVEHAGPGVTARSGLDNITPLGWVVALGMITGLIELEPVLIETGEPEPARPELLAARRSAIEGEALTFSEKRLTTLLSQAAAFLATPADDDAAAIAGADDANWPWSVFRPLVEGASTAVSDMIEAAQLIDGLYGLRAVTRRSQLFQISDSDDRGLTLVSREGNSRANLAGWQIDRDSLTASRLGDLEVLEEPSGTRSFVWSETTCEDRLLAISVAYRSLAEFAGGPPAAPSADFSTPPAPNPPAEKAFAGTSADESKTPAGLRQVATSDTALGARSGRAEPQNARPEPLPSTPLSSAAPPAHDQPLYRLRQRWHKEREGRGSHFGGFQPVAIRIALLQMPEAQIGNSFWHPICETAGRPPAQWPQVLEDFRSGKRGAVVPSMAEAWRRAILSEALERCATLGVELLVLPEYSMRPETVAWLTQSLDALAPRTSVLAGTFRQAARASELPYGRSSVASHALGAVVPLVIPAGAFPPDTQRSGQATTVYSRLKKYPSTGMAELIRPERESLAAVYEMAGRGVPVPDRLRFIRDLVCSEVFMAMSPANIFTTLPAMVELAGRFGDPISGDAALSQVRADIERMAIDTSPAIFRGLNQPRKTIMAVPAATTRPFDHHIFGEAGAKAAGLVTVFTNMGGSRKGQSCFIGHYKSESVEGSHVWTLQSPYHGRAPGIWTYSYSGGRPLGVAETALVVADVNPIDTNSSKPARQIDNLPLTLVAHIPFILDEAGSGADARRHRAETAAREILDFIAPPDASTAASAGTSSCDINVDRAREARRLADSLAAIDDTCRDSLDLRAEGLIMGAIQPQAHPSLPVLLDWAFIDRPLQGVQIETPELEGAELEV